MAIDEAVLNWTVEHRVSWLTTVFRVITNLGGLAGLTAATVLVVVFLVIRSRRADAWLVGGAMLSGWAVMNLLKMLVGRERPPLPDRLVHEASASFPSGHAMLSAILACVCAAIVVRTFAATARRTVVLTGLGLASIVDGASRLYLGAHWLTDVLAGWLLGIVCAAAWITLSERRIRSMSLRTGESSRRPAL